MKLRNYRTYLKKILVYAKACNIEIIFDDDEEDVAEFYLTRRKIRVSSLSEDKEQSTQISSLLHELGHFFDQILGNLNKQYESANSALHYTKPTRSQKRIVLDAEKRAWALGEAIAKKLKIKTGRWYKKTYEESIRSYKKTKTQNR